MTSSKDWPDPIPLLGVLGFEGVLHPAGTVELGVRLNLQLSGGDITLDDGGRFQHKLFGDLYVAGDLA